VDSLAVVVSLVAVAAEAEAEAGDAFDKTGLYTVELNMEINEIPTLTFDDVLLKPGYAGFSRSDIDLTTQLTKNITLKAPLVSAPMDTVTESRLAIALGEFGGIGIIHRNLTIEDQAAEVAKVKKAGQLVGAAVGSSPGYEDRVKALVEAGVDVVVVDSAHGHSKYVIEALTFIKKNFKIDVIAGSVATTEGAQALIDAGADGLRVGMGPGAICTTRIVSGMGVPQLTAILETVAAAKKAGVPVIADGGINYSGDITKALAAGASSVMMGRLFAATEESPGEAVTFTRDQVPARFRSIINGDETYLFKSYRGMGSLGAMERGKQISSEDEFHGKSYDDKSVLVAEGVEGLVPCSGKLELVAATMLEGVKSGFYYVGAPTVPKLWETAVLRRITNASLTESHPHDLFVTNPGNSYPGK
jgi:IMP dehydrogenase